MDGFRNWWASTIRSIGAWFRSVWNDLSYGIMHEWSVSTVVFVFGAIVVLSALVIWRRRA